MSSPALPRQLRRLRLTPLATALLIASVEVIWVHRDAPTEDLLKTVEGLSIPSGELYTWIATESALSRKVRRVLLDTHNLNEEFVKAVGYWRLDDSPQE